MGKVVLKSYGLKTPREGMIDITDTVRQALSDAMEEFNLTREEADGNVLVFCPHTTAAITINENADPDVQHDWILGLNKAYPDDPRYIHAEGNSPAHMKSSVVGCSESVIVNQGDLLLGMWQDIYFCEFDGPRNRTFYVQVNL